jgi:putative DNA primase/helicase
MLGNVPAELRALPQWVMWRKEWRGGKATKVPYRPDGRHAAVNRPEEWSTFEACLDAAGRFDGVGFVFTEGYVGIDIDKCLSPDGTPSPEAMDVLLAVDSYTERSPSGTGLHVIVPSDMSFPGRKKGALECYSTGRFFTVTGDVYGGRSKLKEADLGPWHAAAFGEGAPEAAPAPPADRAGRLPDDAEILAVMFRSKGGAALASMYVTGDYASAGYASQSEADLALCGSLMFFCANDAATADRLFRSSRLMRDKWDARRGKRTYGERRQRAVRHCHAVL